jgi:catechol 2,3-dioxygenase-like lactoylglutathione lyase family enzyme
MVLMQIFMVEKKRTNHEEEMRMDMGARNQASTDAASRNQPKPLLRGIHHLALNTSDMRMTLDFYVRILGMPLVHGMRTPVPPPGEMSTHGEGTPPYKGIPHFFLDMGGDSLLAFFEYPKGVAKADRDTIGAMQHVSFVCGPKRQREMLERLKDNGVKITAGPVMIIPPAIHSFYFLDPNGIRLEIVSDWSSTAEVALIRSCQMQDSEMRAQLASISDDRGWIDEMVAAMSR